MSRLIHTVIAWLICASVLSAYECLVALRSGFTGVWEDCRFLLVYLGVMALIYLGIALAGLIGASLLHRIGCPSAEQGEPGWPAWLPTGSVLACWVFLHGIRWMDERYLRLDLVSARGVGLSALLAFSSLAIGVGSPLLVDRLTKIGKTRTRSKSRTALVALVPSLGIIAATALFEGNGTALFGRPTGPPRPGLNLLLITADTLRADRWDPDRPARTRGPEIDRLVREGAQFTRAACEMPTTGPSHASIMTSLYPRSHGVKKNGAPLSPTFETLAEMLREQGFRTGAFVSSCALDPMLCGLDQGFDLYIRAHFPFSRHLFSERLYGVALYGKVLMRRSGLYEARADRTNKAVHKWLSGNRDERFFLWVHYWDPHEDYAPPPPYDTLYDPAYRGVVNGSMKQAWEFNEGRIRFGPEDLRHLAALYDGEVAFLNRYIDQLMGWLKGMGLKKSTLVVLTADHGESLGEHDYIGHSRVLFDQALRVPLIFLCPGRVPAGLVVRRPVQSIDLLPTILDLMRVPAPAGIQGVSLVPLLRGGDLSRPEETFAERRRYEAAEEVFSVRSARWKYIVSSPGGEALYDLAGDPGELKDVAKDRPDEVRRFRERLDRWKSRIPEAADEKGRGGLREGVRERLEALGYMQ